MQRAGSTAKSRFIALDYGTLPDVSPNAMPYGNNASGK
jgi:hypothetical protein